MPNENPFQRLIRRIRAGDDAAAAELVRQYEPAIRRVVRMRLRDSRLRRQLDSSDICQSVLASFFVRAGLGQFELRKPEDLLKLLAAMVRHKLADHMDKLGAGKRDYRRVLRNVKEQNLAGGVPASRQLAARELLQEARRRLSAEERDLLELRQEGRPWADIAALRGGSAEALRKRLKRAVDRVAQQLGLEDGNLG